MTCCRRVPRLFEAKDDRASLASPHGKDSDILVQTTSEILLRIYLLGFANGRHFMGYTEQLLIKLPDTRMWYLTHEDHLVRKPPFRHIALLHFHKHVTISTVSNIC